MFQQCQSAWTANHSCSNDSHLGFHFLQKSQILSRNACSFARFFIVPELILLLYYCFRGETQRWKMWTYWCALFGPLKFLKSMQLSTEYSPTNHLSNMIDCRLIVNDKTTCDKTTPCERYYASESFSKKTFQIIVVNETFSTDMSHHDTNTTAWRWRRYCGRCWSPSRSCSSAVTWSFEVGKSHCDCAYARVSVCFRATTKNL